MAALSVILGCGSASFIAMDGSMGATVGHSLGLLGTSFMAALSVILGGGFASFVATGAMVVVIFPAV
jgi:hypothetical protein